MNQAEKLVAEFKEASWIASDNRVIRTEDGTWFIAEVTYVDGMPAGYTSPCLVAFFLSLCAPAPVVTAFLATKLRGLGASALVVLPSNSSFINILFAFKYI